MTTGLQDGNRLHGGTAMSYTNGQVRTYGKKGLVGITSYRGKHSIDIKLK